MCDLRYFKSAYNDFDAAKLLLRASDADERYFNMVAYHMQQAVEKTLKAFLECVGVTVPNTHGIDKLIKMSRDNGSRAVITDWLADHEDMLTRWEAETRYNMDFSVEKRKVDDAVDKIEVFLVSNGLSCELRAELKDEQVMSRLKSYLPADREFDDFELNCLYQVNIKRLQNN